MFCKAGVLFQSGNALGKAQLQCTWMATTKAAARHTPACKTKA